MTPKITCQVIHLWTSFVCCCRKWQLSLRRRSCGKNHGNERLKRKALRQPRRKQT